MAAIPRWGLFSSAGAAMLLIGGWTLAAAVQPVPFDQVTRTISELAALDTPDRWVMTVALVGVGLCHCLTAVALRAAATPGRYVLAAAGVATVLVAAAPLPGGGSSSRVHMLVATTAFVTLAGWPAFAATRHTDWVLSPQVCAVASVTLLGLVAWLFGELLAHGDRIGLAERVAAGAQAIWPLVVVARLRAVSRRVTVETR